MEEWYNKLYTYHSGALKTKQKSSFLKQMQQESVFIAPSVDDLVEQKVA